MTTARAEQKKIVDELAAIGASGHGFTTRATYTKGLFDKLLAVDQAAIAERTQQRTDIWRDYMRNGTKHHTPEQRKLLNELRHESRDMSDGGASAYPGATSGFLIPMDFRAQVVSAMRDVGPMLDQTLTSVEHTQHGRPLSWPSDDDALATGVAVTEAAQVPTLDIQSVNQTILGAFKYSSGIVRASLEFVMDADVDLDSYLAKRFATRLGRIINTKLTLGSGGGGEPTGFMNSANVSSAGVCVGAGPNDGASGANSIGSGDFHTLTQSLDWAYHTNAVFMCHQSTLGYLRAQLNKQGSVLWPGLHMGRVPTIMGYEVKINNNLDALQTVVSSPTVSRKVIAFGDFSRYQVRMGPMWAIRLQERFADFGQVAWIMFARVDGNIIDTGSPIRYMTTAA